MAEKELAIKRLQQRHDTAQNWKVKNPILAEGELGVETDTGNIKAGNGTTTWNSLPYSNAGGGGGGTGGGDDGYFPLNEVITAPTVSTEIKSDGIKIGTAFQIYNPASDEFKSPKYMLAYFLLDDGVRPTDITFSVSVADVDEVSSISPEEAEGTIFMLPMFQSGMIGMSSGGYIPLPYSNDKPIWLKCFDFLASDAVASFSESLIFRLVY